MGIGKILGYAALGVGAVAAAPFTGGGSIFGAATLAGSLAGAGTIAAAAGAGAVGAAVGHTVSQDEEEKDKELSELRTKANKLEKGIKRAIKQFQTDREYFSYIIALTAVGMAMANADGEISDDEKQELKGFIGGIASSNFPEHVKQAINELYQNPPNFNTAIAYLEKVKPENYGDIKILLEIIMLADNVEHEKEKAFLTAFDSSIEQITYRPDTNDTGNGFVLELQRNIK